jgi:FkbM family methyltransferase
MLASPIRPLRGGLTYLQRVGRWPIVLMQVRGASWSDQWTLVRSALAAPVLSLRDLHAWRDPILIEDAEVNVRGVGRFLVRARCDDLWHVLPWRETAIANALRANLRAGDTFIDAGANIGIYSVLAARLVGPHGTVIAIEMMPDTADRLERNLTLNNLTNVTVHRAALSDVAGDTVTAFVTPGKYGQASIAAGAEADGKVAIQVSTTTLDALVDDSPHVRLMKMDLEGVELQSLLGGRRLLAKTDHVIYESWGATRATDNRVDTFLSRAGFRLMQLDGNNWIATRDHSAHGFGAIDGNSPT